MYLRTKLYFCNGYTSTKLYIKYSKNSMNNKTLKDFIDLYVKNGGKKRHLYALLSDKIGVSQSTIRNWCNNKTKPINKRFIQDLEEITGVSSEKMFG